MSLVSEFLSVRAVSPLLAHMCTSCQTMAHPTAELHPVRKEEWEKSKSPVVVPGVVLSWMRLLCRTEVR